MVTAVGIMADSKQQGPPFDPTQLTGLVVWFDASDLASITQVANAVSQWNDKSLSGFHVTQAVGANQPLTNTSTLNGKNVLTFNGTTQFLTKSPPVQVVHATTGEWSCYSAFKTTNNVGTHCILDQDSLSGTTTARCAVFCRTGNTNLHAIAYDTILTSFIDTHTGIVTNGSYYASNIRRATEIEAYRNGTTSGPTATTGTPQTSGAYNLAVGAGRTGGAAQSWWQGDIAEIIVYNTAHTTIERQKMENYLKAKWGL